MNLLHALTFGANAVVAMLVAWWLSSPAPRAWQPLLIAAASILWSLCTTWPIWRRLGLLPWFRTCPAHGAMRGTGFRAAWLNADELAVRCPECDQRFVYSRASATVTSIDPELGPAARLRPRWPGFTGRWRRIDDPGDPTTRPPYR